MRDLIIAFTWFVLILSAGIVAVWVLVEPMGPPAGYERPSPVRHLGIGG